MCGGYSGKGGGKPLKYVIKENDIAWMSQKYRDKKESKDGVEYSGLMINGNISNEEQHSSIVLTNFEEEMKYLVD